MDRDRAKDELYESAQPMENVTCLTCRSVMRVAYKDLYSEGLDAKGRIQRVLVISSAFLPAGYEDLKTTILDIQINTWPYAILQHP